MRCPLQGPAPAYIFTSYQGASRTLAPAMRVASSMLGVQPSACRLAAPLRARQCSTRRALAVVRAQQGHTGEAAAAPPPPPPAAAPAEQQLVVAPAVPHTAAQEAEEYVQVAAAESDASYGASAAAEQQAVAARQAVPPPAQPAPGGAPLGLILQHPAARIGGMAAAAFLGTTLLITLFRMSRDPQHKRSKVINKNKVGVDGGAGGQGRLAGARHSQAAVARTRGAASLQPPWPRPAGCQHPPQPLHLAPAFRPRPCCPTTPPLLRWWWTQSASTCPATARP